MVMLVTIETNRLNTPGGYSGFQMTEMIEWGQKSKPKKIPGASNEPQKIPGPKSNPQKILRRISEP